MGALTINTKRYGRLLARTTPKVIETEGEHGRLLGEIENLMDRGAKRTAEEDALLALLASLVQDYEAKHFPLDSPAPHEVLRFLMEKGGLKQASLVSVFGSSGYVADVVNGRRGISKNQAKKLAAFFGVGVDLFI